MAPPFSAERIAALLSPFLGEAHLSDAQLNQVSTYLDLLVRWNAKINLTAVRDAEQIITRHFGESFFAARHLLTAVSHQQSPTEPLRVPHFSPVLVAGRSNNEHRFIARTAVDIGSGAGFPGVTIKIFSPEIELALVESSQKKAAFLREVVRSLKIAGVTVLAQRAEQLNCTYDLITLRAVEQFETILPIAARVVAPRGRLALLIGTSQFEIAISRLSEHLSQIGTSSSQIGKITWSNPIPIPLSRNRILAVANFD
jgi:16S rRNA (guanine527-N7)-methyltransferase